MPTERLDDDCFIHKYFWDKHSNTAKKRLKDIGHDPNDVKLMVERVELDRWNIHWKHRCNYCNECRPKHLTWCRFCEVLDFRHNFVRDMHFLVDEFGAGLFRVIFYLKKQKTLKNKKI